MNDVASQHSRVSVPPRAMPELSCPIQLNTDFAQRVYKRAFDHLKGDLYVLTVRTRSNGKDEAARAIDVIIADEFASVRKDLDIELERADAMLDAAKITQLAGYDRRLTTDAKYSTPRAKEYLDLVLKMDQLLMRYDTLWLHDRIADQPRMARCQNWQRRLIKVANRLRDLGNKTRAMLSRDAQAHAAATPKTDSQDAPQGAEAALDPVAIEPASEESDQLDPEVDAEPDVHDAPTGEDVGAQGSPPDSTAAPVDLPSADAGTTRARRRRVPVAASA